jgi:hypothetical protein
MIDSSQAFLHISKYIYIYANHPLLFYMCIFIPISLILSLNRPWSAAKLLVNRFTNYSLYLSLGVILSYIFLVVWYATIDSFCNSTEIRPIIISWLFDSGHPIYHEIDSPEQYIHMYGPYLYLINWFFLKIFTPSYFSAKLVGVLASILSIIFLFISFQKVSGYRIAIYCTTFVVLIFFLAFSSAFQSKADSLIFMCVSLGLMNVLKLKSISAIILNAIVLGVSINLKVHSFLYFLPVIALFYQRFGKVSTFSSLFGAFILIIAPFLVSSQISAGNYINWLLVAKDAGLDIYRHLPRNLEYLLFVLLPVIIILFKGNTVSDVIRQNKLYFSALIAGVVGVTFIALRPGTGPHHLLPFIPTISYFIALLLNEVKVHYGIKNWLSNRITLSAILSFAFAALMIGCLKQYPCVKSIYQRDKLRIPEDINRIMTSYPNAKIGMAYTNSAFNPFPDYRYILVFSGNPYLIDLFTLVDLQASGRDVSRGTINALASGYMDIWLVPKGGLPFNDINNPLINKPVFTEKVGEVFLENYELRDKSKYYDIWFRRHDKKVEFGNMPKLHKQHKH